MAQNNRINMTLGFNVDNSGLQGIKKELAEVRNSLQAKGQKNGFTDSINETIKAANQLEDILNSAWNSKLGQLDLTKVNNGMRQASFTASSLKKTFAEYPSLYQNFGRQVLESNIQLKESNKLLDKMAVTMANTVRFGISSSIFNNLTGSISKAYNYSVNLDKSLNNIRIVSNQSADNMERFAKQANEASKNLGATTLDYTNAALIYYQQGLNPDEVEKMTDITIKMKNVTGDAADDVSSYMTAIWNNFADGSENLEHYADVITALGASTASSSSEIAEGLSKFASVGETIGLTYEYATSALATVVATTRQSADTVGTAFKTLFSRIQGLNLGETLDDGTTLNKYSEALNKVGINIKTQDGQLKDMNNILDEMGSKWGTLSKDQQVALAQTVAGVRQYNQLISLMDNWDVFKKNLETAQNSTGELAKQNEVYLESVEAHLNRLRTEAEKTYKTLFDTDAIKSFADVATGALSVLNSYLTGLGGGLGSISTLALQATTLFSKQIGQGLSRGLENQRIEQRSQDTANLKDEIIKNYKGDDTNASFKKELEYAEKIAGIRANLTTEEYQALTQKQKEIALLEDEIQKYNQMEQEVLEIEQRQGIQEDTIEDINWALDDSNKRLKEYKSLLESLDEGTWDDTPESLEKMEKFLKSTGIEEQKVQKYLKDEGLLRNKINSQLESEQIKYKDLDKAKKNTLELEKQDIDAIKARQRAREEEIEQAERLKREEKEIQDFVRGASTFASTLTSIGGIVSTITDKDLTGWEKFKSILSVITVQGASLVTNWKSVKSFFKDIVPFISSATKAMTAHWGATLSGVAANKAASASNIAEAATEKVAEKSKKDNAKASKEKVASQTGEIASNQGLAASNLEVAATEKVAGAAGKTAGAGAMAGAEGVGALGASLGSVLAVAIPVAVAIAAVAGVAYVLYKAYNADADAAKAAAENAERLKEAYEETKTAADELNSTIEKYKEIRDSIDSLEKGTIEWKQAIIDANAKALELLKTYKDIAKYATRDENGMISISDEGLKEIQNQQLNELRSQQERYFEAERKSSSAKMKSDITNFRRSHTYGNGNQVSESVIQDIASYMARNNITDLIPDDLNKIDSFTSASEEMRNSILKNIEDYSKLGNSINSTKEQQNLYAKEIVDARRKLREGDKDPDKETQEEKEQREVADRLNVQYQNNAEQKDKDVKKVRQEYLDKELSDMYEKYGVQAGSDFQTTRIFGSANMDMAKDYAKLKGYDENVGTAGTFIFDGGARYTFTKNGKKVDDDKSFWGEELSNALAEEMVNQAYEKSAEESAKILIKSVDDLIKNESLDSLNEYDKVLSNFFKSGASGKFEAVDTTMSQQQAKELLSDENQKLILDAVKQGDFWERQGFGSAEEYVKVYKEWLESRASKSDATAFGSQAIETLNQNVDSVIEQSTKGELSPDKQSAEYAALVTQVQKLKELYPELTSQIETFSDKNLIGTDEWKNSLYDIQIALSNLDIEEKVEEWDNSIKDFQKDGKFNIDIDDEKFNDQMDKILDKDYSVTVAVEAQMDNEFDQVFDGINDIDDAVGKIQEGWKVSKNDIVELGEMIPGIAENYKITADGMVQLDEQTARSAINAAQVRMEASKQETIKDLENAAKSYNAKADAYDMMAIAAQKAADNEIDASEAVSTINAQLDKIDEENSNLKAINEQENSSDTVEVGIKNTQTLMDADAQWAKQAIENAKAVAKAKSAAMAGDEAGANQSVTQGTVSGSGAGTKTINDTDIKEEKSKVAAAQSKEDWQKLAAQYQAMADQNRKAGSKMLAEAAALKAASNDLTYDKGHAGDKKGSGKDKSGKEAKQEDLIEDEKDRYHDVNIELEQISETLDRLQKQQDKLVGKDLIDNLNKQLGQLNKQIETTKEKIKIAKGEASELKDKLSGYGVTFNADGTIGNYAAAYQAQLAYVNGIIASYNAMSADAQEAYKDTVDNAKENFNKFKDLISKYDDLIVDTIPGLEDDIQEALDEQVEIQIQKFNMEIEIRLDMSEAERDWNAFKKKIIDGIKDDDILGNAKANLLDISSYYKPNGEGIIETGTGHINDILGQLKQMDATGTSDVYGNNRKQALEDLKTYYEQTMSDLEGVQELVEEIEKSYLDAMDEVADKMDDQLKVYEMISDTIDHDMKLIELVYGDEAYGKLANYYQKQEDNYNRQVDFQRQQVAFWADQMNILEKDSEAWKKAKEEWMNATKDWQASVEKAIQNIKDEYVNAINEIFQNLNKEVTNGAGLDYVNTQWELINKNAEQYLDNVNGVYETQKLQNKYLEAIDDTDSLTAQRELRDIMNEEIGMLQERDKLTQYDIDRAELKYQIALKRIALEEAQQNKSTMRLKRDSQGNYSYQYVADEDEISKAQNELSDLYNQLYNLDTSRYRENLGQIYDIWAEFQEKMAEAAQINDPEERAAKELLLREEYGELINGLIEQNENVRLGLHESAFLELADLYDKDYQEYQNLSDAQRDIMLEQMIPQWTSGVQEMADVFAGEDGFEGVCEEALDRLSEATQNYEDSLDKLEETAGVDFDSIGDGIDTTIDYTETLLGDNKELITSYQQELSAIQSVIAEMQILIAKYDAAKVAAIGATEAAYKYWQEQQRQAAAASGKGSGGGSGNGSNGSGNGSGGGSNGGSESGSGRSGGSGDGNLSVGDTATLSGKYYYDSYGTAPSGSKYSGVANGVVVDMLNNNPYGVHIHSADGKYGDLGWVKRSQLSGYDTGGYTGSWGTDGRLALLHQKELVLNAKDTENMLNAVSIMRDITNTIGSTMLARLASLSATGSMANINGASDTLEQNVHIDATFPNVTSSTEIENAFNNLMNIASQRINKR